MSKHFCCCIPVRVAVFFASLATFLGAGFGAAIMWLALYDIENNKVVNGVDAGTINNTGKIVVIVAGVLATLVALLGLFGFVGSIIRNRRMVRAYSTLVWLVFLLHCASVGIFLYFVFSGKQFYKDCTPTDSTAPDGECSLNLKTWQKIVYTAIAVVGLLVTLYIASIIGRYKDQLYEEGDFAHEYRVARNAGASTYEPTYYPSTVGEAKEGLLNPAPGPYPYSDAAHSFGNTARV